MYNTEEMSVITLMETNTQRPSQINGSHNFSILERHHQVKVQVNPIKISFMTRIHAGQVLLT